MSILDNLQCRSQCESFRLLINVICKKLGPEALRDLKFQCRTYIGVGKLERIKTLLELFTVLEEMDLVCADNVQFLVVSLDNIFRKDLVKLVEIYENKWLKVIPESKAI